jgi:hypothetical protein
MIEFTYPTSLYDSVKAKWNRKLWESGTIPVLPNKETFKKIIDIVCHASFLTEERRRIWFRVAYISPDAVEEKRKPLDYIRIVKFDKARVFSVNELMKLAPAADPTQVLIGVHEGETNELAIWGLIEAGTSWWDFGRHEASSAYAPPNTFTVSSKSPGQITISRTGEIVMTLDQGKIIESSANVFYQGPVADFLERGAQKLYKEVCKKLEKKCWDPEKIDDDFPKRFYIMFIERILNRIREKFHGGTLIVVPDEIDINDTRLKDRVVIKYHCYYDSWETLVGDLVKHSNYYDLLFKLWKRKQISEREFSKCHAREGAYEESEEMVKRAALFLSSLSAVDGAVVITDKLRLLGFGAEIIASSPSLDAVRVITEFEKNIGENKKIELFGTRHRSAFRFCSSFDDSVVFIVSQDGEIKVAKRVGSEVILWSNINIASLGF